MVEIPQPQFFSVPKAAKICGVSRNTLYSWVRQGKLGAYQTPGRTNLIRPSDLVKFMQQNGMFVPPGLMDAARKDEKTNELAQPPQQAEAENDWAVLIVDDDAIARSMVVRAVHGLCNVYQAETGYEALHLLTKNADIQIVLLDLRMPGQHGSDTLLEIKQLRPEVPIIVVTGYSKDIAKEMIDEGKVARLVEKPYTVSDLRRIIEEVAKPSGTASLPGKHSPPRLCLDDRE